MRLCARTPPQAPRGRAIARRHVHRAPTPPRASRGGAEPRARRSRAPRRPSLRLGAASAEPRRRGDLAAAQLHLAQRARALRLPLLPGTRAAAGRGPRRRGARLASGGRASGARARGTLVHRLLEPLDFAPPAGPRTRRCAAARRRARACGVGASGERGARSTCSPAALRAARAGEADRGGGASRREYPFALLPRAPSEPLLSGVIDLLAEERDGGALVIDYKSDRVAPERRPRGRWWSASTAFSACSTRSPSCARGRRGVEVVHWFLERPAGAGRARYSARAAASSSEPARERLERAPRAGFAVSPQPHRGLCLTCPGAPALCSWSEAETLRESPWREPGPLRPRAC